VKVNEIHLSLQKICGIFTTEGLSRILSQRTFTNHTFSGIIEYELS
jgi:hypothetical protein